MEETVFRRPLLQRLDVKSVAVFRALQLGDMLCAVPALRALRWKLPQAHVILVGLPWASQFAQRFRDYIDEFIAFPGHPLLPEQPVRQHEVAGFYTGLCRRELSLSIQLHGSGDVTNEIVSGFGARVMAGCTRGAPMSSDSTLLFAYPETGAEPERLLAVVSQLGAEPVGDHLEFPITFADEQELADSGIADGISPGQYICVHPGARHRDKCWPPVRFAEVADQLAQEFRLAVVLTGSAAEAGLADEVAQHMRTPAINAAAPISIGAMACLMRGARLLLCNDTGVSHIAAGLKLNSVVIFSKADIARWSPLDRHRHRCIWDPSAERASVVLEHARALLSGTEPSRQRAKGMWPYW
jgi:ADP-heptose:LPS heptosyltransferase